MGFNELKRHFNLWFQAIRPRTLALSISPVLMGSVLAWVDYPDRARLLLPLLIIIAAVAIQAATNLFNDSADYLNGTDDETRIGPQRITASGQATPEEVMRAGYLLYGVATLIGIYLVQLGGWPILLLGILSLLAGYAYSHGPWPISRSPFGELFVILFFGIGAVVGTYYLHTHLFHPVLVLWGLVAGFPAAAVLLVNNTRDRESDARAGRRTLPILAELSVVRWVYTTLMLLPFALMLWAGSISNYSAAVWVSWLAIFWSVGSVSMFWRITPGPVMNPLLGKTVRAQLIMVVFLALGLFLSQL